MLKMRTPRYTRNTRVRTDGAHAEPSLVIQPPGRRACVLLPSRASSVVVRRDRWCDGGGSGGGVSGGGCNGGGARTARAVDGNRRRCHLHPYPITASTSSSSRCHGNCFVANAYSDLFPLIFPRASTPPPQRFITRSKRLDTRPGLFSIYRGHGAKTTRRRCCKVTAPKAYLYPHARLINV